MANPLTALTTGFFESFDGTKIYYETRGQGEPIVFVYGIACLMNHYHHQIDYFSKSYQVISFDLRGHGRSELPTSLENMTLDAICEDISCLLRNLSIHKAHFVGHSFGVPVLIKTYDKAPDFFKSLIFINGFAKSPIKKMFGLDFAEPTFFWVKRQFERNPILVSSIWKTLIDNPLAARLAGLLGGFNLKSVQFKDIEIYGKSVSQISLDGFIALFEQMMIFNGMPIAKRIQVPTLILSGEGSHCCQLDFPELVNGDIEAFLKRQP
jgi:pimeloyl-ACP methyl ester carboxylesterase